MSWRDEVEASLSKMAQEANADDELSPAWKLVLGGLDVEDWARAVTLAFEARLREDKRLRYLVQTLDYRQDQAGGAILTVAVQDMARSLRRIAWSVLSIAALITGSAEIIPHIWR